MAAATVINTPDQRLRVFVSSTLAELAPERSAVRSAIEQLRLTPVMFELGARPHPPRELYRAYLDQSQVFIGVYWQRYGWVAPGESVSGLEDEYRLAGDRPRLLYLKHPSPERDPRLDELVAGFAADGVASYRRFSTPGELGTLVANDLALLLTERFATRRPDRHRMPPVPAALTATIGRETDVEEVVRALGEPARLVTLTGPGGIGKTRLALEVARRLDLPDDRVGFVSLAEDTAVDRALRTVAEALGAAPEGTEGVLESLTERLRGGPVLLVLDNLEQVQDAGPALADLLQHAPSLTVLATSRHALRVQGEREVRVAPLALPAPGATPAAGRDSPGVRLFASRLGASGADLELTDDEVTDIVEICRLLDGVPLAIELAAARARVLSLPALRARMADLFDALGVGATDLPERQRTLRATIEWSHRLLDEDERTLLADLSVFAGGWILEAAEEVATGDGDVIGTLASLLDKSLVEVRHSADGADPRFAMLGTVRAFAAERLAERGDADDVRLRHLAWVRGWGHRAQPQLCGPGQREWLARVDPERANLREAIGFALRRADDEAVVDLAWDVVVYYFVRDAGDEPDAWLRAVHDAARAGSVVHDARLRCLLALTRIHFGDFADAETRLGSSLAVFRREGMPFEAAVALHQLGFVHLVVHADPDAAVRALEESSALFDGVGHEWGVALAEAMLGSVLMETGDLPGAGSHLLESLARATRIDCDPQVVRARTLLALLRVLQSRPRDAVVELRAALPQLLSGRFLTDASDALAVVAAVAVDQGRHDLAARASAPSLSVRERLGVSPWPAMQTLVQRVAAAVGTDGAGPEEPGDAFEVLERLLAETAPAPGG